MSVGRICEVKGYDLLIAVAQKLAPRFPDWQWHVYGKDGMDGAMQRKAAKAGVSNFLIFKGEHPHMEELYSHYSIFVMTSYFEGLPLSILEAQTNMLPVISFDCPTGPAAMVSDNENGFLILCYDVDAMTGKLAELMESADCEAAFHRLPRKTLESLTKRVCRRCGKISSQSWHRITDSLTISIFDTAPRC